MTDAQKLFEANYRIGALQYLIKIHIDDDDLRFRFNEHMEKLVSVFTIKSIPAPEFITGLVEEGTHNESRTA